MQLQGHKAITDDRAALLLSVPGNVGLALHGRGGDTEVAGKLRELRGNLAVELNLESPVLAHSDPVYQEGLRELAGSMVRQYEQQASVAQFKYRLLVENRRQETGKNAGRLDKRIIATKK